MSEQVLLKDPGPSTISTPRRTKAKARPAVSLQSVCMADVRPEAVEWLWDPYIPRGKLSLLEGNPGVGKSHLALKLAADLSMGRPLPGESGPRVPARTLLISTEDGLADTIRPRLDAAGADPSNIFVINEPFALDEGGLEALREVIRETAPALVIIDPLIAVIGGKIDTYRANQVRQAMTPLARLAEEEHCAIVVVRHWRKGDGSALEKGAGSVDFMANVRSGVCVAEHPDDRESRVMAHVKCNLGPRGPSLTYTLKDGRFTWTGTTSLSGDDLAAASRVPGPSPSQFAEAERFLRKFLAKGARPAVEVLEAAKKADIAQGTLHRAKKKLDVQSAKAGKLWMWSLNEDPKGPAPVEATASR